MKWTVPKCIASLALSLPLVFVWTASAAEPGTDFLNGLRDRGYFDLAIDYLDRVQKGAPATPAFKAELDFHRGTTLKQQAEQARRKTERDTLLAEAEKSFVRFTRSAPTHELVAQAQREQGSILFTRARVKAIDAETATAGSEKEKRYIEARDLFTQAQDVFRSSIKTMRTQIEGLPKDRLPKKATPAQRETYARRDRLRDEYVQLKSFDATIEKEIAGTFTNEKTRHAAFQKAADALDKFRKAYRTRPAALFARLLLGDCYREMGKLDDAIGHYRDLIDSIARLPNVPDEFRKLRTRALANSIICWRDESQQKFNRAIEKAVPWLEQSRRSDDANPYWLELRYQLALAYQAKGQSKEVKSAERVKARSNARRMAQFVAEQTSSRQEDAVQLLSDLGVAAKPKDREEYVTFEEARDAGRKAFGLFSGATRLNLIGKLERRLTTSKDPALLPDLEKRLADAQSELATAEDDALYYLNRAITLADPQTPTDDVNEVRYLLTNLHWQLDNYFESAVFGEFVGRRYSRHEQSGKCALIALASYIQLYRKSTDEDRSFETGKIIDIANHIVSTWPDTPTGDEALTHLITFMVIEDRLDEAKAYVTRIPVSAPGRAVAELQVGQALWSAWQSKSREGPAEGTDADVQKRLTAMLGASEEFLSAGLGRVETDQIKPAVAEAVIALVQLHLNAQQITEAMNLLEDKNFGPLGLIEREHPAAARLGYDLRVLQTALRVYIASLGSAGDQTETMKKISATMDLLSKQGAGDAKSRARMLAMYVLLAQDLEKKMAQSSGSTKQAIAQGYARFLEQVGRESDEVGALGWVANSLVTLGESYLKPGEPLSSNATKFFEQAADIYGRLESLSAGDTQQALQTRVQLASVLRRLGKYSESQAILQKILEKRGTLIHVQIEAARTYQQWARSGGKATLYLNAVLGGRRHPQTNKFTFWGWKNIARRLNQQMRLSATKLSAEKRAKYSDSFFEAQYAIGVCHYSYALRLKSGDPKRTKYLQRAKTGVQGMAKIYPNLGGKESPWPKRYETLLTRIQKQLGEQVTPIGRKRKRS